jgi:NADPH:quinone reductase
MLPADYPRGGRVIATVSRGYKAASALDAGAWKVLVRDEIEDLGVAIGELVTARA